MPHPDWNERYQTAETPWDTGEPDDHLVEFIRSGTIEAGRALDIGCGTGTNAIWLAGQGFPVLGVDFASLAIEKARAKAADAKLDCRFEQLDFLTETVPDGLFDFVFDRGCFHVFEAAGDRERFAERVASLLAPGGRWLSLIGSTEGAERDWGPPRRSARDVADAIEPALEILELRSVEFRADLPGPAAAWLCLSRPREVPAQPSTQRR
ncbi:MAG: methyltransferase domain-containing protein [Gammaproteobacteria bacterium]